MKKAIGLLLGLALAGCGASPPAPRLAPVPSAQPAGVLAVRIIGPLSLLPIGFAFPLDARGLELVVRDAGGRNIVDQTTAISQGVAFLDQDLVVPAGTGYALNARLTGDHGLLGVGGAVSLTVAAGQVTPTTIVLQAATGG